MKRFILALAFLLLWATVAGAQPTLTLGWDMDGETPTTAQTNTYRYFLDNAAGIVMTGVLCGTVVVNGANVTTCNAAIPAPAIGTHTVTMNAENQYGIGAMSAVLSFKWPAVPPAPKNLRLEKLTSGGDDDGPGESESLAHRD